MLFLPPEGAPLDTDAKLLDWSGHRHGAGLAFDNTMLPKLGSCYCRWWILASSVVVAVVMDIVTPIVVSSTVTHQVEGVKVVFN